MIRRLVLFSLLLSVGCRAQAPADAALNTKIERQVRTTFGVPAYVNIAVGARKASSDFPGYDSLPVTLSFGEKTQTLDMLLSKDGKSLLSVKKMDLTKDPQAETMAKIDLTGRPVRGNKDAKVTVVVYDDFQCPYCSRMHQTLNDVMKTYGDRVKLVYKDFPLFEIHPWAGRAAIDSECLAQQSSGAFWDFADYVHANGRSIQGDKRPVDVQLAEVDKIALDMGKRHSVDAEKLAACVKEQPKTQLEKSVKEAESIGVEATPVLFVNGSKLDGAVPQPELEAVLNQALREQNVPPPAAPQSTPEGATPQKSGPGLQ